MLKTTRFIAVALFCALASIANAQSYTTLHWGIDRTSTPNEIAVKSADGASWFKLFKLTAAGQPTPYFASTFCAANEWITATSGVPACSQPAFSNISGDLDLATQVTGTLPVGNGGTGLTGGTSGGIPYFSAADTLASSAALTANMPVIGGGAGVAPSVGTKSGNTTAFVTTTGAQTSGDCVSIDANGNHIANGAACSVPPPVFQGRLSLATGVPVMTSSVTGGTTIYYVPYTGKYVTIYDGATDSAYSIGAQISLALGTNWAALSAFDVFATLSGGNPVLCTVTWTNLTTRATALDRTTRGYLTNTGTPSCRDSNSSTITLAANQASYLGSFYTNASTGQVDYIFGASASGGTAGAFGLWNYHNRVRTVSIVTDSGASYTYTSGTIRAARASNSNRTTFMIGVAEDSPSVVYQGTNSNVAASAASYLSICYDSTSSKYRNSTASVINASGSNQYASPSANIVPEIGQHFVQACEGGDGTNANNFDNLSANSLQLSISN